jgi:hypothetical protein
MVGGSASPPNILLTQLKICAMESKWVDAGSGARVAWPEGCLSGPGGASPAVGSAKVGSRLAAAESVISATPPMRPIQLAIIANTAFTLTRQGHTAVRYELINAGSCKTAPCSTSAPGTNSLAALPFINDGSLVSRYQPRFRFWELHDKADGQLDLIYRHLLVPVLDARNQAPTIFSNSASMFVQCSLTTAV